MNSHRGLNMSTTSLRDSSSYGKAQVSNVFRKTDIFLEPFEEGICIRDNLTKTHRLLFNKYPSRQYHVLVITKEKENQGDLLNALDF